VYLEEPGSTASKKGSQVENGGLGIFREILWDTVNWEVLVFFCKFIKKVYETFSALNVWSSDRSLMCILTCLCHIQRADGVSDWSIQSSLGKEGVIGKKLGLALGVC